MTVKDLIKLLQTFPSSLPVAFRRYSESVLMEPGDIKIEELGIERPDGWIPDKRPDQPSKPYLMFPGN